MDRLISEHHLNSKVKVEKQRITVRGLNSWMALFNLRCQSHSYSMQLIFWKLRELFYCANICRIREIIAWVRLFSISLSTILTSGKVYKENEMHRLKFHQIPTFSSSQENKLACLYISLKMSYCFFYFIQEVRSHNFS